MQNIAAKKRARQEDVDSDYLFVNAKREMLKIKIKFVLASARLPVITWSRVGLRCREYDFR